MEAYVDAMNQLGRRVAGVLAVSLDLPPDAFSEMLAQPLTYSQLFHYPPAPSPDGRSRFGAGAHSDWGFLTILLQDDVGGFEIRGGDSGWQPVPPVANTFVIILGEMVLRLTNGFYRPATHRVAVNASGRSRYSMPTFFDPPYDDVIAPVSTCAPLTGAPRYPECTVVEHMREMASGTLSSRSY
jgi:isopenicillin N synthase-like dioxygenase